MQVHVLDRIKVLSGYEHNAQELASHNCVAQLLELFSGALLNTADTLHVVVVELVTRLGSKSFGPRELRKLLHLNERTDAERGQRDGDGDGKYDHVSTAVRGGELCGTALHMLCDIAAAHQQGEHLPFFVRQLSSLLFAVISFSLMFSTSPRSLVFRLSY